MSTEKELLSGLLSAAYQMDDAGVASLYNEDGTIKNDALETLKKLDIDKVSKLKVDTKKFFDDGYKKATSESLSKYEQTIQDTFKIKSDKKGIELISEIISEQVKAAGGTINEDAIKKHPLFISTVDKLSREKEEAIKAESEKFTQFQTELQKKETFNIVAKKAKELFLNLKPVLSQDKNKADMQIENFVEKLKGYEYDPQNDNIIVLKDGKVYEDKHGHRIPFEVVVKQIAETYYDFHEFDQKRSPANDDTKNKTGKAALIEPPKNEQEFNKTIGNASIPVKDRIEYKAKYGKQFQTT